MTAPTLIRAPRRTTWGRAAALAAAPAATAILVAFHPHEPRDVTLLAPERMAWLAVHIGLLVAIPILAIVLWRLLEGVRNRPAMLARVLLVPAAAFYAAFDALLGIGTGVLMQGAGELDHHHGVWELVQYWWDVPGPLVLIGVLGPLSWAALFVLAAVALARSGAGPVVWVGVALSGLMFAWGHPGVTGTIAMLALAVAILASAVSRRRAVNSVVA